MAKRVLFALTSQTDMGGGAKTGSWLEELAASYYTLVDKGVAVDLASVNGGDAPIDPASLEEPWITDNGRRFLKDDAAMAKLRNSLKLSDVKAADYDAVYMIGGAGTAWDFPDNAALGAI
ncbi:MAG TPA: type 1 glutamine amidotransferase domain-containing protein, partial [Sphingomonadales bacterium]